MGVVAAYRGRGIGFAVEGLCRRHIRVEGEYHDSYLMARLFDDRP